MKRKPVGTLAPGSTDPAAGNRASDAPQAASAPPSFGLAASQRHLAPLPLPHERDESVDDKAHEPDSIIVQAGLDIDAGLVDTDMRATPGLDADAQARLIPGPAGKTRKLAP